SPLAAYLLARACLPVGQGVASRIAAELVRSRPVAVGSAATVLRIVLPLTAAAAIAAAIDVAIAAIDVAVRVEVVAVVYIDVVAAAPSAVSPSAAPSGAHSNAEPERDRHACRIVADRRVVDRWIGVGGRGGAINDRRVVGR